MSAKKITDLLPITSETQDPHAYQVFGLEDGEQDPARIKSKINKTVQRLNAAKADTDPKIWKQAARLVKQAQETLKDPDRKAQLDARFGIIPLDDNATSPPNALSTEASGNQGALNDPLAGLLPNANPLAPTSIVSPPSTSPAQETSPPHLAPGSEFETPAVNQAPGNQMPPGLFGAPESTQSNQTPIPSVVRPRSPRRKRSKSGAFLLGMFSFVAFGVIGGLLYFLIYGSGPVAVSVKDGTFSISSQTSDDPKQPNVSDPRSIKSEPTKPRGDDIMGDLGPSKTASKSTKRPSGVSGQVDEDDSSKSDVATDEAVETPGTNEPSDMAPLESEPEKQDAKPEMQPPLSDEVIARANEAIQRVQSLIRTADWQQMKSVAEATQDLPMTDEQSARAQALFEVADLATYYRGGIEKAIADLEIGNDFEVTSEFRVIVVETGPDLLVVRFDAKNRSYNFDQLPWALAHKLASFSMPKDPSSEAAKAVYQAISPNSNEAYRNQALNWLEEIQGEVQGGDPKQVAETIRALMVES